MSNPPTLQQSDKATDILIHFMESIQEWESEVEGKPTATDEEELDAIYANAIVSMSEVFGRTE